MEIKPLLAIFIIVAFVASGFIISGYLSPKGNAAMCDTTCIESVFDLTPLLLSIGVLVGALAYYLLSNKIQKNQECLIKNVDIILRFLDSDEKRIIEKLIEENGKVLQAELTRLEGIGKVKSHRILKKLFKKGIITIEGYGKTNIIKLVPELKEALLK